MKFFTFLSFSIVCVSGIEFRVDPLVITTQGLVRGLRSSDGSYSSFLGIPYALLDLNNPFGPPQQHPGFGSDVFNAYYGLVKCPQVTPVVSNNGYEILDCLRLNVYSPTIASSQNPLPVLVWIHGGDFGQGFAGEYGPEHLVKQNIIVVTINYRLGPYGFMCLDIPSVPGNQGLKDQYEALLWISNNIAAFGGNPYNITIAGQEAGATSVLLHLFSDKQKVYSKVIAESGTPQSMGTVVDGDVDAALKLAGHLGFITTDSLEALSFLSRSSHELVTAAAFYLDLNLKPCKEKSFSGISNFIENYPFSLSNHNKVQNTPILIGHTSRETLDLSTKYDNVYFESDPFYNNIKENFNLDEDRLVEAANIIRNFYIGDEPVSKLLEPELEKFDSDIAFYHPLQRTITQLLNENASPIFVYEFSYSENEQDMAEYGDELKYLFHMLNNRIENNEKNQLITERIVKLWSNFVKFGNPTPETSDLLPMTWTPVTARTRPYIVIDSDIRIEHRINKERMAFWDLFYAAYGQYNRYSRECNI
ncbi:esterase FE4-like [Vanessa tameamea]|uniref:Esterase FE4-like n=1 Tax=Vanessa tameamea TaxID=334116 RepID=A0ABM4AUS5_VANTA